MLERGLKPATTLLDPKKPSEVGEKWRSARGHCLTLCVTMHFMEKTLTIRLHREQDEALTQRAKTAGKTRSALVRELLAQALSETPISERAGHLKGSVQLEKPKDAWSRHLRKQNWR